jgi:hypothetical protein
VFQPFPPVLTKSKDSASGAEKKAPAVYLFPLQEGSGPSRHANASVIDLAPQHGWLLSVLNASTFPFGRSAIDGLNSPFAGCPFIESMRRCAATTQAVVVVEVQSATLMATPSGLHKSLCAFVADLHPRIALRDLFVMLLPPGRACREEGTQAHGRPV